MRLIQAYFLIALFSCFAQSARSQSSLRYEHFTSENGLSNNFILSIAQDSIGYLWIATNNGLNRYDGNSFKRFFHDEKDSLSLSDDYINRVYVDSKGVLWIATRKGLSRYDAVHESFCNYGISQKKPVSVHTICDAGNGKLWLGTNEGLKIFVEEKKDFQAVNVKDTIGFFQSEITKVFTDASGNMWLGSMRNGLRVLNLETMQVLSDPIRQLPDTMKNSSIEDIYQAADGSMWFASTWGCCSLQNGRVRRFIKDSVIFSRVQASTSSICDSKDGSIWFGLYQSSFLRSSTAVQRNPVYSGIAKVDLKTGLTSWYPYKTDEKDNLTWGYVTCMFKDSYGMIWIGTSRGLNKLNLKEQAIRSFVQHPNLSYNLAGNIYAIYKQSDTCIWLGMDGNFGKSFNPEKNSYADLDFRNLNRILEEGAIYAIAGVGPDELAFGTQIYGLLLFNLKTKKFSTPVPGPGPFFTLGISGLAYDSSAKTIWIGWMGAGLMSYNMQTKTIKHFIHDEKDASSISSNQVSSLVLDKNKTLWIGTGDRLNVVMPGNTEGNGLNRLDISSGKFTHYVFNPADSTSVCSNNITSLAEDAQGGIWVGTLNGLNYLPAGKTSFSRFTQKEGLPGNYVTQVCLDDEQNLWIGTWANGLCRFDTKNKEFRYFDIKDGLQDLRFNANAVFKDEEGRLYFGGVRGFNVIDPKDIPGFVSPGPSIISEIIINGRKNTLSAAAYSIKELSLPYNKSNLQFTFFSPDYSVTEKRRFFYKLEGFDNEWQDAGKEHAAKYTHINPGSYTLHVKAVSEDGAVSGSETGIKVVISPPFWQTWWFYSISVLALIFAVFFFIRVRTSSLRSQKQKLEETVEQRTADLRQLVGEKEMLIKEIHHRVKNNLEVIGSLLELQSQGIDDAKARAAIIEGQSRVQSIALIHHTLYGTDNVASVEFKSFVNNLYKQVAGVFKQPGTEVEFHVDAEEMLIPIVAAVPIGLILNELLTNTFKYAVSAEKANHIRLQLVLQATAQMNKIVYTDNGPGLPQGFDISKSSSLGMKVIQLLTKQLGGTSHFYNDNGSRFEIPFKTA